MELTEVNHVPLPNLGRILNAHLGGDAMDKYRSHGWVIFKDTKYRKKDQWVARRVKSAKNKKYEKGFRTERLAIAFVQEQIALTGGMTDEVVVLSDQQRLLLIEHIRFLGSAEIGSPGWQVLKFINTADEFALKIVSKLLGTIGNYEGKHTEEAIVEPLLKRLSNSRTIWTWGQVAETALSKKRADIAEVQLKDPAQAANQTKGRLRQLETAAQHAIMYFGSNTDIISTNRECVREFRMFSGKIRASEMGRESLADSTLDKIVTDLQSLVSIAGASECGIDMSCFDIAKLSRGDVTNFSLPALDVARLMAAASMRSDKVTIALALCFFGGLRVKEALLLKGECICLKTMKISIRADATKAKSVGKTHVADVNGLAREIDISPTLYQWLVAYRSTWNVGNQEFMGMNYNKLYYVVDVLRKSVGISDWGQKDTGRHTFINCLYSMDVSIGLIKKLVGHSKTSEVTKKHYLKTDLIEEAYVLAQVTPTNLGQSRKQLPLPKRKTRLTEAFKTPDWAKESVNEGVSAIRVIAKQVRKIMQERMRK